MNNTRIRRDSVKNCCNNRSGMALLTAILFISVGLIVLAALSNRYIQQRLQVDQFQIYQTCFEGVESAIAESKVELELGNVSTIGLDNWTPVFDETGRLLLPDLDASGVSPASLSTNPELQYIAYVVHWGDSGRDDNGDGVIDSDAEQFMYSVHAAARYNGLTRQVEVVYRARDVNVWRNAIFAGNGQAGGLINGNVSIHGSVHLLGENLLTGSAAIAAMEMSGTSLLHNNYVGMPAGLFQRIPPLPTVDIDGVQASTLEAVLRVRQGLVSMSGNSEIGEPQIVGATYKGPMDGVFVNDGWTGNSVINDGGRGTPTRVTSDNGWDALYDLGQKLDFPLLSHDWREPDGSRIVNPNTGNWYSHEDYFSQVLLADPAIPDDGIFEGNLDINARNSPSIYWNATTEEYLTGAAADAATPGANDDYLQYNASNKVLRMNGQIRINGDLSFTGQGNDRTIHYTGRAALLAYGDVNIDANLLACNNGNPTNFANSFPQNNIIGIMASQNMMVGGSAQLSIMGAFYAQGTVSTQRQSNIIGSFVANYFDMGTNVPSIFQVPTLADNLPFGMIGNFPLIAMGQVSWREIGIS